MIFCLDYIYVSLYVTMYYSHYLTCHTYASPHGINNHCAIQRLLTGQIKSTITCTIQYTEINLSTKIACLRVQFLYSTSSDAYCPRKDATHEGDGADDGLRCAVHKRK